MLVSHLCVVVKKKNRDLTEPAGFVSNSWRITSKAMFGCCCLGVMCLVISLECLRRVSREYDNYIVRQSQQQRDSSSDDQEAAPIEPKDSKSRTRLLATESGKVQSFRPNLMQQIIRSSLHMVQFGVAYLIMLLAMYFNGYIILSILVGAFVGPFIFNWERIVIR